MLPGRLERRTHDSTRHGATSLFAALDARTARIIGQNQQRHRSLEWRNFLDTIENNGPAELDVHLILDNYGAHASTFTSRRLRPVGSTWWNAGSPP